jgi:hypothetical protein
MESLKQNINYELSETTIMPENVFIFDEYKYHFLVLFFGAIGFIIYKWTEDTVNMNFDNFLDVIERRIGEYKHDFTLFINKLILQLNMEGNAIKNTQYASYNSFSKSQFLGKWI